VRIACVGAGPAGLYFATLSKLLNPEHDITICERGSAESVYGWGVTFGPELLEKLYANDPESAGTIQEATLRWRNQFVDIHGERVTYDGGVDVYNLNRPRLVGILAARARQLGVRIKYGEEIVSRSQLQDADLIVAADGVHSRIRQEAGNFGTEISLSDDKYIWLGTDKSFSTFAHHFVETDYGWIWASSYGVESELSTFVVHCTPETWSGLGFDSMPTSDSLTLIGKLFQDQLTGHRLMGQIDDEANARWLSFKSVTNQRWHDGNVVLLGDSAHTTHFSAGQGTTLAIEDAIALASALSAHDDLSAALAVYERQRRAEISHAQHQARLSGQWFAGISRYIDLNPREFTVLLHARRSSLLPLLPPRLYYQIHRASREVPMLRELRSQLRPAARAARAIRHRLQSEPRGRR
jgi:2-polyprenyl-6-methoxyphenol hydroxylase-like FAD-dependent oxidoreductase